jgi:hypothetical protein
VTEHSEKATTQETIEIGESVLYQELEDQVVLLNMNSQLYFSLDPIGAVMWRLLLECGNVQVAAGRLCGLYQVDEETAHNDFNTFVRELAGAGLVKTRAA